jgi:hypothetical protein
VDVTPSAEVSKAKGDEPLAKDNFLKPKYRKDPYREYSIHYSVNAGTMQFMPAPDLSYHGRAQFVIVVYDDKGEEVNSRITTSQIDVDHASYDRMIQSGFGTVSTIAILVKGNYFLRVGIHDLTGDKVGTLEVPVDQIKLELPQSATRKN